MRRSGGDGFCQLGGLLLLGLLCLLCLLWLREGCLLLGGFSAGKSLELLRLYCDHLVRVGFHCNHIEERVEIKAILQTAASVCATCHQYICVHDTYKNIYHAVLELSLWLPPHLMMWSQRYQSQSDQLDGYRAGY